MRVRIYILSVLIGFLLISCKEEKLNRDYPFISTLKVTNITSEGATFSSNLINSSASDLTEHGFIWGTDKTLSIESSLFVNLGVPTKEYFEASITSTLLPGKTYFVRSYVKTKTHCCSIHDGGFCFHIGSHEVSLSR